VVTCRKVQETITMTTVSAAGHPASAVKSEEPMNKESQVHYSCLSISIHNNKNSFKK
jgi:hypothetical protein